MSKQFRKICLADSDWQATKNVLLEKLQCQSVATEDADLLWSDCQWEDNTADPKWAKNLKENQTINYFPGSSDVFRKDTLTDNISKSPYSDILPKSWNLPAQYQEFTQFLAENKHTPQYFIVKENDEQRGVGIYITDQPENDLTPSSDVVVSKYIGNPLLIDDCKFDFRIHVLVASLDPFKVYVHYQGLMRMASVKYEKPTLANRDNLYMHLTNLSLNKNNKNSCFEGLSGKNLTAKEGYGKLLRSYTHFEERLRQRNIDPNVVNKEIDEVIAKVLLASHDDLKANYEANFGKISQAKTGVTSGNKAPRAFQLLGFDIMLDEFYKPWFIEVNHNPDFPDDPLAAGLMCQKTMLDTMEIMAEINGDTDFDKSKFHTKSKVHEYVYKEPNMFREIDMDAILNKNSSKKYETLQLPEFTTICRELTSNCKELPGNLVNTNESHMPRYHFSNRHSMDAKITEPYNAAADIRGSILAERRRHSGGMRSPRAFSPFTRTNRNH